MIHDEENMIQRIGREMMDYYRLYTVRAGGDAVSFDDFKSVTYEMGEETFVSFMESIKRDTQDWRHILDKQLVTN